ncbi:MAG: MFS transporter [Rhodobacterales bacterium]|nr:MAG: MFS transporter [Rhodobacterales bacterium]
MAQPILRKNRNFHLLISSAGISNLGDGVSALAFPWLATLITRDPFLIALVGFATRLPWLLFAIPAGVITDRADRCQIMFRADLLRLLLTTGVIALIFSLPARSSPDTALFFILALSLLAFALGLAEVLRDNAAQTVLPSVVAPQDLETANGRIWSVEQVAGGFIGPPLAGFLIAFAVPAPFFLDAATFGIAATLVWCMAVPLRPPPKRRPMRAEMAEGWRWMRANPMILRLALMLGVINCAAMMVMTMLVLYSQDILGLGPVGHGLLLTCGAAGGVLGGLLCPSIVKRLGRRTSLLSALSIMPAGYALYALTTHPVLAGLAEATLVFTGMLWNVVTVSYRQRMIPDALLGRVNALYRFFGWGSLSVGALLSGALVALAEPGLGRDLAIRLPFALAALTGLGLLAHGAKRLHL